MKDEGASKENKEKDAKVEIKWAMIFVDRSCKLLTNRDLRFKNTILSIRLTN